MLLCKFKVNSVSKQLTEHRHSIKRIIVPKETIKGCKTVPP